MISSTSPSNSAWRGLAQTTLGFSDGQRVVIAWKLSGSIRTGPTIYCGLLIGPTTSES